MYIRTKSLLNSLMQLFSSGSLTLIALCVALFVNTGAAQSIPSSTHEASRAWATLEAQGTGIYETETFLFAVAELPWGTNPRRTEARASQIASNLLVNHFLLSHLDGYRENVARVLLNQPTISSTGQTQLRLNAQVIENGPIVTDSDTFRRVVAIRSGSGFDQSSSPIDIEQTYSSIVEVFVNNWLSYPEILSDLGLYSLALIAKRNQVAQTTTITNILAPVDDPIALRSQYQTYLEGGYFGVSSLSIWPADYLVVSKQLERVNSDQLAAMAWRSISCVDDRSNFGNEYMAWSGENDHFEISDDNYGYVVQRALKCMGFVGFDERFASNVPDFYSAMSQVFLEGRDLNAAFDLAHQSVETSPRYSPSWGYLSAAYQASSNNQMAVIFARTRLSADPTSVEALRNYLNLLKQRYGHNELGFLDDFIYVLQN